MADMTRRGEVVIPMGGARIDLWHANRINPKSLLMLQDLTCKKWPGNRLNIFAPCGGAKDC